MYLPTLWNEQDIGLSSDTSPSSTATIPLSPTMTAPMDSQPFTHQPVYSDPSLNLLYSHYLSMDTPACSVSWTPQPTFTSMPSVHITPAPFSVPYFANDYQHQDLEYSYPYNNQPQHQPQPQPQHLHQHQYTQPPSPTPYYPDVSSSLSSFYYTETSQGPSPIMTRSLDIPVRTPHPPKSGSSTLASRSTKNGKQKCNSRIGGHKRTKTADSLPTMRSTEVRCAHAKYTSSSSVEGRSSSASASMPASASGSPSGRAELKNKSVDGLETELGFLRDETVSIVIVLDSLRSAFLASTSEDPMVEPNRPLAILTGISPETPVAVPRPMIDPGTARGPVTESFLGRSNYTPDMDKEVQTAYDELMSQVKQLEKKVVKLEEQVKAVHVVPSRSKRTRREIDEDNDYAEGSNSATRYAQTASSSPAASASSVSASESTSASVAAVGGAVSTSESVSASPSMSMSSNLGTCSPIGPSNSSKRHKPPFGKSGLGSSQHRRF
ncbi:hypothetical protein J3Q64DRAFT_1847093 [Phycomyces blakesleeanus]|uniref:Uncharacterized protein n=2 Tax=Phycomyces blakesleeanus TaxID=4837 RepID=A0A167NNW0_PHYB8|nr:hypothetical protein PHYBLDRAFT_166341 [Phycomyces blakesleeanus NRRL 1555(-)]OAD76369.1 hypothetical protein PHYBLDRAFT_166341 [Phycomyces blakesleeanus NRRL 1555(-)]|eukprot:XP_018294409.1 hypothetical protein PHYBLDRAFT_166341 [Phycomyces blakesleeanus NRRL 1555(-)]